MTTVIARIEPLRKDKQIGTSLEAKVVLSRRRARSWLCCSAMQAQLPMLFIVSEVEIGTERATGEGLEISIDRASGVKCERCWRYVPPVSDRSGPSGHLRSLRRRVGGDRQVLMASLRWRAVEIWIVGVIVVLDQVDQGDGQSQSCRCTTA